MEYDFTSIMERRGHDAMAFDSIGSTAWDSIPTPPKEGFDFIPLWVADMNFPTFPGVTKSIIERAEHPAFGYFAPSEAYFDAIIKWRGASCPGLEREHIGYENGVHGFITSAVQTLTTPGEGILVHSPMYLGFHADIEGLDRHCVFSPLYRDEEGIWRMDYEDMDAKIKANHVRVAIFCSPHNPTGRVWEREELKRALAVFEANEVTVICDEIWADIVFEGNKHIPLQSVNAWARQHVVAAYAPSKTFNLAGLIGSYHVIYNDTLRHLIEKHASKTHYNEMNVLSMHALIGAYTPEGREWVGELNRVLEGNARFALNQIEQKMPGVSAAMPQGTYMLFLDFREYLNQTGKTLDDVLHAGWDVGVGWQDGRHFHGPTHIRMNLASPLSRIEEAFNRIENYVLN